MSKTTTAMKKIAEESNPANFAKKLRGLPVTKRVKRVIDRML